MSYLDRDINVALVMHSLGGFTGSAAVKDLSVSDRRGMAGISSLIYLCPFLLDEGISIHTVTNGTIAFFARSPWPDSGWIAPDKPPHRPQDFFYNDLPSEIQEEATARLRWLSEGVCHTPAPYAAWKHVESNFLICELDGTIAPEAQEGMTKQLEGMWKRVERIDAGHSPFMSKPAETAAFVRRCLGEDV